MRTMHQRRQSETEEFPPKHHNMKSFIVSLSLLLCAPLVGQTKVVKKNAVKANDYGVSYNLPKTKLVAEANYTKWTWKAGPYFQYAKKYLGVEDVISEDRTFYKLGEVSLRGVGEVDKDKSYMVAFKPGTVAPYVMLTEDGLLCAINTTYEDSQTSSSKAKKKATKAVDITEESVLSEELLMAGSLAKQAEVAAKQIYRIRESRLNILTGEADNVPPDGQAMQLVIEQLEAQERTLTNLFVGTKKKEDMTMEFSIMPSEDFDRNVLFRFSESLGVVDADDLGGAPVYMSLTATERAPQLSESEAKKKAKTMREGLIYNTPGKAAISIEFNRHELFSGEVLVTQFGTQEVLAPVLFEDKKAPVKITFFPETGSIKQIIQ